MRLTAVPVVTASLWLTLAGAAAAAPVARLTVDNVTYDIPLVQIDATHYQIGAPDAAGAAGGWALATPEFSVSLRGMLDADPSIAYTLAVVDFLSPTTFSFLFGTPIVPVGTPNTVAATLTGSLTDATGNGVALTTLNPRLQIASVSSGGPPVGMGVDLGTNASFPPTTTGGSAVYGYGPFNAGPTAGPGPGPWTQLLVAAAFSLSGGSYAATIAGSASIEPGATAIPEPGALVLTVAGLAALGTRRRMMRRCLPAAR